MQSKKVKGLAAVFPLAERFSGAFDNKGGYWLMKIAKKFFYYPWCVLQFGVVTGR